MLLSAGCSAAATPSPTETPVETGPLQTGDIAPDFTLPDGDGNMISLADQLSDNQLVILVFYNHYT
jgi:peroxiredoxin